MYIKTHKRDVYMKNNKMYMKTHQNMSQLSPQNVMGFHIHFLILWVFIYKKSVYEMYMKRPKTNLTSFIFIIVFHWFLLLFIYKK
jgi:hypothetical protein